jgi:ubiquitin thioesterase OTU1
VTVKCSRESTWIRASIRVPAHSGNSRSSPHTIASSSNLLRDPMSFRVRLRLPSSKQETLTLSQPATVRSLLEGIQPFVNVDPSQIELRFVYPSKLVDLGPASEWDRDVKSVGINNGEGLVVSVAQNKGTTVTQSDPPVPPPVSRPIEHIAPPQTASPLIQNVVERPRSSERMTRSSRRQKIEDEPPEIAVEGGSVILRIMADDNSCMYLLFQYI